MAGALDLAAALVFWSFKGVSPVQLLQYIASARIGEQAFAAGVAGALTGVFLHFAGSFLFAAAYVVAACRLRVLGKNPYVFGPLYGLGVYAVMTFIVVPMSYADMPAWPPPLHDLVFGLSFHLFLFGLPIALAASRIRPEALQPWSAADAGRHGRFGTLGTLGAIGWGGLIAGILDIAGVFAVWAFRGVMPVTILQSIASSLQGREAFQGGIPSALLGLFLHFAVSFTYAAGYVVFSAHAAALRRHPVIFGLIYGVLVAWLMTYVVVPMTRAEFGSPPPSPAGLARSMFIHTVLFGLPIALVASRIRRGTGG